MNPKRLFSAGVQEVVKKPFTSVSMLSPAQLPTCLDLAATRARHGV